MNHLDPLCRSFKDEGQKADYCFEFSSEGEYQQIASLVDDALKSGKKCELIFFSPSVEKAIVELSQRHPHSIRYLRYPLASFSPRHSFSHWVSAHELILVRYDLFPEFLFWSLESGRKLKLLWVSFKKERELGKKISWLKKTFLKNAQTRIYASQFDQEQGKGLGFPGSLYDFRIEQINRRMKGRMEKFDRVFPTYSHLKAAWENFPREKRLIIGNAWPSDLVLIKRIPADFFVLVVPHKLEASILKHFRDAFFQMGRTVEEVTDGSKLISASTLVLNKKGVLCELYADFGKAYVGGGFEGSIHSVLEPLVAGADMLACGPAHHRSTEYDLACAFGSMTELKSAEDFDRWLANAQAPQGTARLAPILNKYPEYRREVISC